jgi:hypothetical protein
MRKIIDSNFLRSDELRTYLSRSRRNEVVLNDYAFMEAYKGDTLNSIYHSMEVLVGYPRQVIVLKSTGFVCGLRGRVAGLQRRMIDARQTREFGEFCQALLAAKRGDLSLESQLLDFGRVATVQMDRVLADLGEMPDVIEDMAKTYSDTELKILRKGEPATNEMMIKFIHTVMQVSATLFRNHPQVNKWPNAHELPYTFIFRSSLCWILIARRWISVGGAKKVKTENLRNDMVDGFFASYATYFDGLLSFDKKLVELYREASALLDAIVSRKRG